MVFVDIAEGYVHPFSVSHIACEDDGAFSVYISEIYIVEVYIFGMFNWSKGLD